MLPKIEEFALSGFYLLPSMEGVKCIYCDGIINKWELYSQHNILEVHLRFFPKCLFANGQKAHYMDMKKETKNHF